MSAKRVLWFGALACASLALSCSSCRDEFVAELVTIEATVHRDFGRAPAVWSAANTGDRFAMGDGLRTGSQGLATLALPRRARLLVKSDTIVRFRRSLDRAAPSDQIEVEQGELTIETGALDLGVPTERGVVKLKPESNVHVRAEREKTIFDVIVGRVEYTLDGEPRTAEAGSRFELDVLPASLEPEEEPKPEVASTADPAPDVPEDEAGDDAAAIPAAGKPLSELSFQDPPASAILTLPAGESATIHDPAPPTDVRITFDACPELGVLELDRGNSRYDALRGRGTGEARVRIPRGTFKYRLRCARGGFVQATPVRRGRLIVVADAATRPLPLAPATITADADGRRYTVSFQNRLPIITLRWPNAPPAKGYRLFLRPAGGSPLTVESSAPSVTLPSGRVNEGVHQFWFETRDKQRSEDGRLQVSFDYAARTAYLTSPAEGAVAREGRTQFAGGTLLGSSVRVQGSLVPLDGQGRFRATVEVPAGSGGAHVRVEHRSTGIHYYVRHLR